MNQCKFCNTILKGRPDKKFCSKTCSNHFHSRKRRQEASSVVVAVNKVLESNWKILLELYEGEKRQKIKVSKLKLSRLGFNFKYITGIYYNREGKRYHYVYDLAWMEFSDQEILIIRRKK